MEPEQHAADPGSRKAEALAGSAYEPGPGGQGEGVWGEAGKL